LYEGKNVDDIINDLSDDRLVDAIDYNRSEHLVELHKLLQSHDSDVEFYDDPQLRWFISGIAHPLLNVVKLAKFNSDDIDARIESVLSPFKSRGLPMTWWVGPASQPTGLGKLLEAHGLVLEYEFPGMALDFHDTDESTPPELTIERVADSDMMQQYRLAFKNGFGLPDSFADFFMGLYLAQGFSADARRHYYIGLVDGEPSACSTLDLGAGVAGVYAVGTMPEHRGKGYGRALSMAPLQHARERGYRISILQSTAAGLSMYERIGYQEYCKFQIYVWKGESN
jgi:GNAT superfamily N-acetyltransferase